MSKKCSTLRRLCSTLAAVVKKSPKVAAVCGSVGLTRRIRPSVKWARYYETVTLENVTVSYHATFFKIGEERDHETKTCPHGPIRPTCM